MDNRRHIWSFHAAPWIAKKSMWSSCGGSRYSNDNCPKLVLRQLLLKQPIILQKNGRMETLGGKQQCSPATLRSVLARLHNWVILVREVLRAELPEFETFSSLSTILRLDNEPSATELKDATARMAAVLGLQAEPCLNFLN